MNISIEKMALEARFEILPKVHHGGLAALHRSIKDPRKIDWSRRERSRVVCPEADAACLKRARKAYGRRQINKPA